MTYIKLILAAFFWGGTFIAGKALAGKVDPYSAAFLRFSIASIFLVLLTRIMEGPLPRVNLPQILGIFFLGATGIFSYNLCFFTGLTMINANRASLIIATNPIFISLASALFFKEPLSPGKLIGLALSVTGALVIITDGQIASIFHSGIGTGELFIFGCVASWVSYSIMGKKVMNRLTPLSSVCYSSLAGTLLLSIPALFSGTFSHLTIYGLSEWASLFYLGFFGTVLGFFWYYQGIQKIGPMKAGVFINFVPVSALILAFFLLGETLTPSILIGAILVISGVCLTNFSGTKKQ